MTIYSAKRSLPSVFCRTLGEALLSALSETQRMFSEKSTDASWPQPRHYANIKHIASRTCPNCVHVSLLRDPDLSEATSNLHVYLLSWFVGLKHRPLATSGATLPASLHPVGVRSVRVPKGQPREWRLSRGAREGGRRRASGWSLTATRHDTLTFGEGQACHREASEEVKRDNRSWIYNID
jgi:hypothetical protein